MQLRALVVSLGVLALPACDRGGSRPPAPVAPAPAAQPAQAAQVAVPARPAAGAQHFGEAITATETVRLADLLATPARFNGRAVRTEGTVSAVCQRMGCWMELQDGAATMHVRMHGHAFFIPRDATGRRAVVQATLQGVPDGGGECAQEAHAQTGQPPSTIEIDALGVDLL
jgi:hypothetical protein